MGKQTTHSILMVKPAYFGYNPETAESNSFQKNGNEKPQDIRKKAAQEFDQLVTVLTKEGIEITVYNEPSDSILTDSVFPNNWFSTHQDGTLITYPMFSKIRREERKPEILDYLSESFYIYRRVQLERHEKRSRFLEGTGCMILDRENRIAYACQSRRMHTRVLEEFCFRKGYEPIVFDAFDKNGLPIYHTNVIMSLGKKVCVICQECITDEGQRESLFQSLQATGKEIINISFEQVCQFAGNVLEVENKEGEPYLVMSTKAFKAFSEQQLETINKYCKIVHTPIPTIENYGGGGVRCMMAEIFLPKKAVL